MDVPWPCWVPPHPKPRISVRHGIWSCRDVRAVGLGFTPVSAFTDWQQMVHLFEMFTTEPPRTTPNRA